MSLNDIKFINTIKERKTILFSDLENGKFFKPNCSNNIYVKTRVLIENKYNALEMPFGLLAQIEDSRAIEEIIIEEIRFHYINEKIEE